MVWEMTHPHSQHKGSTRKERKHQHPPRLDLGDALKEVMDVSVGNRDGKFFVEIKEK